MKEIIGIIFALIFLLRVFYMLVVTILHCLGFLKPTNITTQVTAPSEMEKIEEDDIKNTKKQKINGKNKSKIKKLELFKPLKSDLHVEPITNDTTCTSRNQLDQKPKIKNKKEELVQKSHQTTNPKKLSFVDAQTQTLLDMNHMSQQIALLTKLQNQANSQKSLQNVKHLKQNDATKALQSTEKTLKKQIIQNLSQQLSCIPILNTLYEEIESEQSLASIKIYTDDKKKNKNKL